MNYYLIAKFIHILGAFGFFVALGVEWLSLRHTLQALTSEQVRERLQISNNAHRIGMPFMALTVISGFYMMVTVWGAVAWIVVALAALVLLIVLAMALTRPRMMAIAQALATENGPVSPRLRDLLRHSILWLSVRIRLSIALGIVFLMTVKPGLAGSLLVMIVTIFVGLALGLPIPGRSQVHKEPAQ